MFQCQFIFVLYTCCKFDSTLPDGMQDKFAGFLGEEQKKLDGCL